MVSAGKFDPANRTHTQAYAVVIFLPPHLDELVMPLRERYDPDCNAIPSHVTLVFELRTARPLDELARSITSQVAMVNLFKIELSSIGDFYPAAPFIYWRVKPNPTLNALYKTLHAQLDIPISHKEYIPHVTVAKEISPHRVMLVKERIVSYLPDESFWANAVDLVSPVAGHWVSVRTFPLNRG